MPPSFTGVRNYLKDALVNIIAVHAEVLKHYQHSFLELSFVRGLLPLHPLRFLFPPLCQVFTVSKDLVPRVLSRIVESVADEMCRLMQCVSSFSKNGALQVGTRSHAHAHSHRAVSHS